MNDRIKKVFVATLNTSADVATSELIYNNHPAWDSVAHMKLIAALEQEFDCMLEMDDILAMSSFDKAVEIVRRVSHGS